jgi:hypothetical protein
MFNKALFASAAQQLIGYLPQYRAETSFYRHIPAPQAKPRRVRVYPHSSDRQQARHLRQQIKKLMKEVYTFDSVHAPEQPFTSFWDQLSPEDKAEMRNASIPDLLLMKEHMIKTKEECYG